MNVERIDLEPDPRIAEIGNLMGKGFLLPAPVLPRKDFRSIAMPTPMATTQETLPLEARIFDRTGRELARRSLGELARRDSVALDVDELLNGAGALDNEAGHIELLYDFGVATRGVDGWLHGLFRYEARNSGHVAETSFGAHIFNTALTWRGGATILFRCGPEPHHPSVPRDRSPAMAVGEDDYDTVLPVDLPGLDTVPWHETSDTKLLLHDGTGNIVAETTVHIACGGSFYFRLSDLFDLDARKAAAKPGAAGSGYVLIRDVTCRLFGYHGVITHDVSAFSLDHMFGF